MKAACSGIRCPSCGSKAVRLTEGDRFACEYCGTDFNFDLDNIEPSAENKIFIEELKAVFRERKELLEEDKSKNKFFLQYYSEKSSAKKAGYVSAACFVLSAASLFCIGISPYFAIGAAAGLAAFAALCLYRKKVHGRYHPFAMHYAEKVVKTEEQINVYTRLLSKLTK